MNISLYRAVWRWHFYAGLFVLPVLAWMAVTGSLYLYKPELERSLYPDLVVANPTSAPLAIDQMIARVQVQVGGKVVQVARPAADDESWRLTYAGPSGERLLAFVKPDSGQVLGSTREGGPMELIKQLHSLTVAGAAGNVLVEIVAGWAIVLVLTGFYLWWPRAGNRALSLAGRASERRFWRNLHASAGALAGAVILFLAVTGMPWTIFWGETFHAIVAKQQIGRPPPPAAAARPAVQVHDAHEEHLPWSLRGQAQPRSSHSSDIGPTRALTAAAKRGLPVPWILDLPSKPDRPYRISAQAERTGEVRMISIDRGSGAVLQDIGFSDFGVGAKAFEWGVYTHQGQQYGEANRLLMLCGCIALMVLAVSAPVMWWKRRRGGRLEAPPRADEPRRARGFGMALVALGLLYPLTGLTMVGAWLVEALIIRRATRSVAG